MANQIDYTQPNDNIAAQNAMVKGSLLGNGVTAIFVTGNPNGVTPGRQWQLAVDTTTGNLYQNQDGGLVWSAFVPAGGVTGGGTGNRVAKFTAPTVIGDSSISDTGALVTLTTPVEHTVIVGPAVAALSQHIMQGTDHVGEAVCLVGYVNPMTFDCTLAGASCIGGQFQANGTRSLGANTVVNTAVAANAFMGAGVSAAYSFLSQNGDMRNDGACLFGTTVGTGVTVGGGAVAAADTLQVNKAVVIAPAQSVSLGLNVRPFTLPGTAVENPVVYAGRTVGSSQMQVSTKNTVAASATCGIEIACDTTVNAGARGGVFIVRGAAGGYASGNSGGLVVSAAAGFPFTTSAANDISVYNQLGGRIVFGADNAGFTPAMTIAAGATNAIAMLGAVTVTAANGIAWGAGLATITSGAGVPASTPPNGSLYMNTAGGALTTFYVRVAGAWVAVA